MHSRAVRFGVRENRVAVQVAENEDALPPKLSLAIFIVYL